MPKTSFLTKLSSGSLTTLAIIILLLIFLNLLDEYMTLYAFWSAPFAGMEEVGPLARSNQTTNSVPTINSVNVVGSTVFTIVIILFILIIGKLWQYRIVRFFLWVLLIGEVVLLAHNIMYGYINGYTSILILPPQSLLESLFNVIPHDTIKHFLNAILSGEIILLLRYCYCHRNKQ